MAKENQRRPENINLLHKANFKFEIQALPDVTWFCTHANLPGATLGVANYEQPFVTVPEPGTHVDFDFLDIKIIVDEDLRNWISIYDWIVNLGFTRNFDQYKSIIDGKVTPPHGPKEDCTLHILTNKMNPQTGMLAYFTDCYPVQISSLDFETQTDDNPHLTADVRFNYTDYRIETAYRDTL
jgi:hypothetical protein